MKEYLIFDIGERTFGLKVSHVEQVVRAATLSDSASASSEIEGLLNLRGQVVPVVNLTSSLGIDQPPLRDTDYLIVVRHGSDGVLAIRSNSDVQLMLGEETQQDDQGRNANKTLGVIRLDSQLVSLLDPEALLADLTPSADQAPGGPHR